MQTLDLVIIFGYLIGITVFGIWYAGKQDTTEEYFVGNRSVPWWAIAMSEAGGDLRVALVMHAAKLDSAAARRTLEQNEWVVERAVAKAGAPS